MIFQIEIQSKLVENLKILARFENWKSPEGVNIFAHFWFKIAQFNFGNIIAMGNHHSRCSFVAIIGIVMDNAPVIREHHLPVLY